jgi:hypothetical protein
MPRLIGEEGMILELGLLLLAIQVVSLPLSSSRLAAANADDDSGRDDDGNVDHTKLQQALIKSNKKFFRQQGMSC